MMCARRSASRFGVALLCLAALACTPSETSSGPDSVVDRGPDRLDRLFDGSMTVIDLTHALSPDGPYWPSGSGNPFEYDVRSAHDSGAVSMGAYSTPEHHGTHIDAPIHSADGQPDVDDLTAADLFGPIALIDVSDECTADPDYQLTVADIRGWEDVNGALPAGAVVLMYTGWSLKWDDYDAYKNEDADGRMHFPGFSEEAGLFLVEQRDIRGIGIDTLSVDAAVAGFGAHRAVNGNGKYHLENVANLHQVPAAGAYLIVAPIKIADGSGGQVRLFAVLPDDS